LYAENIKGISILLKNYERLKEKKLIIFTCGLADYNKIKNINTINKRLKKNIPENVKNGIKIFYLQDGVNYVGKYYKKRGYYWNYFTLSCS
jgi:hypothetical protein